MMTEADTDATESTKPSKTDATTREMHLARLEDLRLELNGWAVDDDRAAGWNEETACAERLKQRAEGTRDRAASLRWVLKRERARS